jgi:hypothetical protein
LPYPISSNVSTAPLEQVFSDVWGPAPLSVGKHAYYVTRVNSVNVLDGGLRVGARGRRMNSKVKIQTNKAELDIF